METWNLVCVVYLHSQSNFRKIMPAPYWIKSRTNFLSTPPPPSLKFPSSPKLRVNKTVWVENVSCRRWSWTSKGRHNFLLQHETREMGVLGIVVIQIWGWTSIFNLHPDLIAFFQVQRRLEGQRTHLKNGAVTLVNMTWPDSIPVQKKMRIKINTQRWRCKTRHSREREKISSRSRCREFPRWQIHGISLVYHRQLERDRSSLCAKWRISVDVEMDGRRFDVGVSDPFLFVCKQKRIRQSINKSN